jgi:hypothetical protein
MKKVREDEVKRTKQMFDGFGQIHIGLNRPTNVPQHMWPTNSAPTQVGQPPNTSTNKYDADAHYQEIMRKSREDEAKRNEQMQQQFNQINQMGRGY